MMWVGCAISVLGLLAMMTRNHLLGTLLGIQLLFIGSSALLVLASAPKAAGHEAHIFSVFVVGCGVFQLAIGCALASRIFFLKNNATISDLKGLKH